MNRALPRLKPNPIPKINPVPEYAVDGRLAELYRATKEGFGVPWMGVVAMAFAQYPSFYETLWSALGPIAGKARFREACHELRAETEKRVATFSPVDLTERLDHLGYAPAEQNDIRACIEVFSVGNMPYVLMATVARRLLEGETWETASDPGAPHTAVVHAVPPLMELHHADQSTRALYDDLKDTLGLPFVNTDYRALGRWPSYFELAWADLRLIATAETYPATVAAVHNHAVELSRALPNPTKLTPRALQEAAARDAPMPEVLEVVRLFQWLLPGLISNVARLRHQMEPV